MAKHNTLGADGELLAEQWLQNRGMLMLHRNWRHSYYEVDIIASMNDTLHFIEVKTRRSKTFGEPEESVSKKKIGRLLKAGAAFQAQYPQWKRVQYNILSVSIEPDGSIAYFYIEDIYL